MIFYTCIGANRSGFLILCHFNIIFTIYYYPNLMIVMGSITKSSIEFRCSKNFRWRPNYKTNENVFENDSYPDLNSTRKRYNNKLIDMDSDSVFGISVKPDGVKPAGKDICVTCKFRLFTDLISRTTRSIITRINSAQ